MNFIVAGLLFHAGEVATFWLLMALMDQYQLKEVFVDDLPGVRKHERHILKLGTTYLEETFTHFESFDITLNYFTTDWIMCLFLNYVPVEMNHLLLNRFFKEKWPVFYRVAISLLKYYEPKILELHDFTSIVAQIKQA